jgi:hypothetical protein
MLKKYVFFVIALVTNILLFNIQIALCDDNVLGVWVDKQEIKNYSFLDGNEFIYSSVKMGFHPDKGEFIKEKLLANGVWVTQEKICSLGDKNKQFGNLMIYIDQMQCCMAMQIFGSKLVLSSIWLKNETTLDFCQNNVLSKIEEMTGE